MACAWTVFDSWMQQRDPNFVAKVLEIMELELHPPTDGPTFCVDEKTGIGVRTPAGASQPVAPEQPARREFAYVRHGTAVVLAAYCVLTGMVSTLVRQRHRAYEFLELLQVLDDLVPRGQVIHLILDPVRMHASAQVALFLSYRPGRFQLHWLPVHASWLSFIDVWFAILSKKCLARAELADFAAAAQHITDFTATYHAHHAHPFTWKKGVRFYQRMKDRLDAAASTDKPPTSTDVAA